jgi:ankyrin repeat protein
VALSYLLAWNPKLDVKDHEGLTPLHVAIRSVESCNTTRPVRFLLLRGASTTIRDNKGKLPIDQVKEIRNSDLQIELYRMLVSFSS